MKKWFSGFLHINPIIVKEIRSRMRGSRAFVTLTVILLLMGGLMYAVLQILLANSRYSTVLSPQVGQAMFASLAFLELFMICAITPAVTSGAISGEKEKQTYEMLMATPLSPARILWGKLVSSMSYVFLLLFAGVPLASLVFIFGGVAPRDMLKALLMLVVIAVTLGVLGLFMSALFGRTGRATVASFITVVVLTIGPLFLAVLVGVMRESEPPRWLLAPSPLSALSAALASSIGQNAGGELFYILGGIFNMGISPISQNGIPRPLYHYSLPIYAILTVVLYLLAMRLVYPTRRWRLRSKEVIIGVGILVLLIGGIVAGFLLTAKRYEWVKNPNITEQAFIEPVFAREVQAVAVEQAVVIGEPTFTPMPPPGSAGGGAAPEEVLPETQSEMYAAVARQLFTVDHQLGNTRPDWQRLYLITQTDDDFGDPETPKSDPVLLVDEVRGGIAALLNNLQVKVLWTDTIKQALDPASGAPEVGLSVAVVLGNIHPQPDGSVLISGALFLSGDSATGRTYILSTTGNGWQITGTTGTVWSTGMAN